jgi:CBS domain-containing protein
MARGLPLEGERAGEKRALDYAGPEVVTCALGDRIGPVRDRVASSAYGFALVLGADRAVMGRLRQSALAGDPDIVAEQVMQPSPSTHRPNVAVEKLLEKLQAARLTSALLTDPDGRLLAVVRRRDLEAAQTASPGSGGRAVP